jgi:hypothetical protein
MASLEACRAAIKKLGERLSGVGDDMRVHVEDRTISCRLVDLDVVLSGKLSNGELVAVTTRVQTQPAQIQLTCSSDDLIELVDGTLSFPHAWATGRLKLNASFRDLYKLRALLG